MPFGFPRRREAPAPGVRRSPEEAILAVLDQGCRDFVFPMLDNGYVYLAATRLSLHRSDDDWALAFELFGFSPRAGSPDLAVWTFGSRIVNRTSRRDYPDEAMYRQWLRGHPHDDATFYHPVAGDWQDADDQEVVATGPRTLALRDTVLPVPDREALRRAGIEPVDRDPAPVRTFEVCRWLAAVERQRVLGTPAERRTHVAPELTELLVLDDWHHPDTVTGELASDTASFRSIARVLATGDVSAYDASERPNTHWSNWPDGGSL